jgi:hypothetical protein
MPYDTRNVLKASRYFLAQAKSGCGANAEGGGGFQPGNTCGKGGGAAAIDSMPRLNRNGKPKEGGDFVANQFKESESYNDADTALRQEAKDFGDSVSDYVETFATEENVRLDSLESPQRILDPKSLKYFVKTKQNDDDGELPLVAQYGDAMIVLDGNHRLNAAKLRGDETSRARVIYLSEIKPGT